MSRYIGFLDIDGVLTSKRAHIAYTVNEGELWNHFDPIALAFLNQLNDAYNIDWVLMSTWVLGLDKSNSTVYHWIQTTFRNAGFNGKFPWPNWKTQDPGRLENRAHMVKKYLDAEHFTYDDFIIFDDTNYDFNTVLGKKRFIHTDPSEGMLSKHMLNALSLTGTWEKRK